jgi:hypothetical protein
MRVHSYPIWLSVFMLLGPALMISGIGVKTSSLIWAAPIVGAGMLILALFYLSKRLHEHMEEVAALRRLLQTYRPGTSSSENVGD